VNYVGVDLHKKTIVLCVLDQDQRVVARRTFLCRDTDDVLQFFLGLGLFQAAVEATAGYEWFVALIEPMADRVALANPMKISEIAHSKQKTDNHDAFVLAQKLARGELPEAHRPTPRQREHRAYVRFRQYLKQCATALKNKIRRIVSDYNADRRDLFAAAGWKSLETVKIRDSDRFILDQLRAQLGNLEEQLRALAKQLKAFAKSAPPREAEARAKLATAPGIGPVTIDVIVSELGDVRRFPSAKKVCAYAGLVPGMRDSGDKHKNLPITKAGSPLLRWALVEAAWRAIRLSAAWRRNYERIRKRTGGKKAIVAMARRLLCVLYAMLRDGANYNLLKVGEPSAA
jgi:transposase